jgi:hypothetical protein
VYLLSSQFPAGAVGGRENCTKQGPSRLFRLLLRPLYRESNLRPVSSRSRASALMKEETDFNVGAALSRAATVSCVARSHLRQAGRSLLSCCRRPTSSQYRRLQLTAKGCESIAKGRSRSRRRRPRLPISAPHPANFTLPGTTLQSRLFGLLVQPEFFTWILVPSPVPNTNQRLPRGHSLSTTANGETPPSPSETSQAKGPQGRADSFDCEVRLPFGTRLRDTRRDTPSVEEQPVPSVAVGCLRSPAPAPS